jgi:hypothetical protein
MSNSLIQAAQKMYSAKYAEAQKDITPIAKGVSYLGANITKALDEKLEEQEKKAAKTTETFKDILLKSEKARPELTSQITKLQDEYFENIKISEGIFRNKEERQKAVDRNNQIANELKAWEDDLRSQDLNASLAGAVSDFEGDAGKAAKLGYVDKNILANNITYKRGPEAGVYAKMLDKDGNIVEKRLIEWKPPVTKNIQGINDAAKIQTAALASAKQGGNWDIEVKPSLVQGIDNILNEDNWQSLLFDNIQGVNWAKEEIKSRLGVDTENELSQEYIDARQRLRDMVRSGKDENGNSFNWKHEFRNDVVNGTKLKYDELAKEYKDQLSYKEERDTTFIAGQYVPNVDLLNNFTAILNLKNKPGRTNATIIAGLPSLGRVWYDDKAKMYVYEDVESSGLSSSEETYKKSMTTDIKQLLSSKTGGISNKFFTQSESNDPFNPNN